MNPYNEHNEHRPSQYTHTLDLKGPNNNTKVFIKYKKTSRTLSQNLKNIESNTHSSSDMILPAKDKN